MKKLLSLLLLFSAKAVAQMPQADMNITGVGQPIYLSMGGIKNNKITYIRETAYVVDTATHTVDRNKIEKITEYHMGYAGDRPLLVKLLAVMGTDTTKLVRSEDYGYDPVTGLLNAYQTASNEGIQMGAAGQVMRNGNGTITGKSVGIGFDLSKPIKPIDYLVTCSGGTGAKPLYVILKYNKNGKEVMDRIHMEYDTEGRLVKAIFNNFDGTSTDQNDITYDSKGRLIEVKWNFSRKAPEYRVDDGEEGYVTTEYVPGATETGNKKWVSNINTSTYSYDEQGRFDLIKFMHNGKLQSMEIYTYTSTGLPNIVTTANDKGQLTSFRKLDCK
jgi:hypothetical protein